MQSRNARWRGSTRPPGRRSMQRLPVSMCWTCSRASRGGCVHWCVSLVSRLTATLASGSPASRGTASTATTSVRRSRTRNRPRPVGTARPAKPKGSRRNLRLPNRSPPDRFFATGLDAGRCDRVAGSREPDFLAGRNRTKYALDGESATRRPVMAHRGLAGSLRAFRTSPIAGHGSASMLPKFTRPAVP